MAFKSIIAMYESKNHTTGLTVKANIFKNGSATTAVGASAVSLVEMDSTNLPGFYLLTQASAALVTLGFANDDVFEAKIDATNVGESAPAGFKAVVNTASLDDLSTSIAAVQTKLGSPAGASVSADIAAVKSDTAAIKADLESGGSSLSTILSNIQSLQNASIGNGVGFVLPVMIIPASGSTTYRVPITIQDNNGALVDPVSNHITVGVLDSSGTDEGSILTGSAGTPAVVFATKDSTGQYHAEVVIPSSMSEMELIFSFNYTIGSNAMVRYGTAQLVTDISAAGLAQQSTLVAAASDITAIKSDIENVSTGTVAIAGILNDGTNGLVAINTNVLANATSLSDIEGASFSSTDDSLHAIKTFLVGNIYFGGRAV